MMRRLAGALIATVFTTTMFTPTSASAIVGGQKATEQYGAVSLWSPSPNRHRCTAALIHPYWAVTAAHCGVVQEPGLTSVRASSVDTTSGYEEVGLEAVYRHPDFDSNLFINDIALLRFQRPVLRSKPLLLGTAPISVDTVGKTAGWGWICETVGDPVCRTSVTVLQELGVKVAPPALCPAMWAPKTEFCMISADETHRMSCFGDSGSPWITKAFAASWVLRGIVVYDGDDWDTNSGCTTNPAGTAGTGVVVAIPPYLPWIVHTMIEHGSSPPQLAN